MSFVLLSASLLIITKENIVAAVGGHLYITFGSKYDHRF